jgi:hypothetical protein
VNETEINNRQRVEMGTLLASTGYKLTPEYWNLAERHRLEWVEVAEQRNATEKAEEREALKAKRAELLTPGTAVLNTVTGARGNIVSVGLRDYKVVRPGGSYVKAPHEQWEAMQ